MKREDRIPGWQGLLLVLAITGLFRSQGIKPDLKWLKMIAIVIKKD
jgi:hypothetical protein